jgi:acetyl-CoA carboxylase biotin carboxylase subunit
LLRRILNDVEFQAARIDTGYLDRLLSNAVPDGADASGDSAEVAAIAAVLFAAPASMPVITRAQTPWQHDALRRGLRR